MIFQDLDKLIASARKNQDADLLRTYQLIKTEMVKAQKDGVILDDITETRLLLRMISERKDSISQFMMGNRPELAEKEQKELGILEKLIPDQPTEEDIENYTRVTLEAYKIAKEEGYKLSMRDMKPILTLVQEKYPMASGKLVSKILQSVL